ncbi:unnamed protein product, partial [Urochloa humidicola]
SCPLHFYPYCSEMKVPFTPTSNSVNCTRNKTIKKITNSMQKDIITLISSTPSNRSALSVLLSRVFLSHATLLLTGGGRQEASGAGQGASACGLVPGLRGRAVPGAGGRAPGARVAVAGAARVAEDRGPSSRRSTAGPLQPC